MRRLLSASSDRREGEAKCTFLFLEIIRYFDNSARNNSLYTFQKQTGPPQATEEFTMGCGEDRLGFIMFECGLEGIKLKVVKKSQFEKGENGDGDKKNDNEILCTDSVKSQEELDNAAGNEL